MPVLTAGSPLREGGIVLERSLANALGIEVGATLAVTTRRGSIDLPVLGTAVVPSQPRYPRRNPGLAWVTPRHARTRRARSHPLALDGGASTGESLRGCGVHRAGGCRLVGSHVAVRPLYFETWQDQRDNALADAQADRRSS